MDALQKIKDFLEATRTSGRALSKRAGSHAMLNNWILGKDRPTFERADALSRVMKAEGAFESEQERDAFVTALTRLPRKNRRQTILDTSVEESQRAVSKK